MANQKSPIIAAILGFLFGGFGLFYVSVGQGIAALGILFLGGVITGGILTPFLWIGCAAWGYIAATNYNEEQNKYLLEDQSRQEFLGPKGAGGTAGFPGEAAQRSSPPGFADSRASRQNDWSHPPSPASQAPRGSFCGECGAELRKNIKFCTSCGSKT